MAIKIRFDAGRNPIPPTLILAKKNGERLGAMDTESIVVKGAFTEPEEINFNTHKFYGNRKNHLWEEIVDLRLAWAKEWNKWFEIRIEIDEHIKNPMKTIYCTNLGVAELSQIMLHGIEINTETDITRDAYTRPTIFWDTAHKDSSLLHRLLNDKAPHYKVIHVDYTLQNLQRTFTFDDVSIYDAFNQIAEELHCVFEYSVETKADGTIARNISVYDLNSYCNSCKNRDEFHDFCPKCGSADIVEGYGEDTGIFVTEDELGQDIKLTTNNDAVKNCFKIEAGDDLVTATVANANPNGTPYIWYFSDAMKKDMSSGLVKKLEDYDDLYKYYNDNHSTSLTSSIVAQYNALIDKYKVYNKDLERINNPLVGYPAIINSYYDCVDMGYYLRDVLMPEANYEMTNTDASKEAALLNTGNIRNVAVANLNSASKSTAENAVLNLAKATVSTNFQVKVNSSEYNTSTHVWRGNFKLINYYDDEDTATSEIINVQITGDYNTYVNQRIDRLLNQEKDNIVEITHLFKSTLDVFKGELKKYCLKYLETFHDACQSCLDIMIELNIPDTSTWNGNNVHQTIYNNLYDPYYKKLQAIEAEMSLRQSEIDIVSGVYDTNDRVIKDGLRTLIVNAINSIQKALDFQKYIGEYWEEFCIFRREQKYSNTNFISDSLTNKELFEQVKQLMDVATKDLYKSAELQHSISSTLKNLLMIPKFEPLVDNFEAGNWMRVLVDGVVYKLRMLGYEINFDDIGTIAIEFSDVARDSNGYTDLQSVLSKASQMATAFDPIARQADKSKITNNVVANWFESGLDATKTKIIGGAENQVQTWDEHGILLRRYEPYLEQYDDKQTKLLNNTIAITNDNWQTVKTAIGNFYYRDPIENTLVEAFGINGETLVGKLIIGESLGIYNTSATLKFDKDGLSVSNNNNAVYIDPNADSLFTVKKVLSNNPYRDETVISLDNNGNANFKGNVNATSLSTGSKSSSSVNANGIYIDSGGNLYAGSGNGVVIESTGSFQFGGTSGITYNSDTDKINMGSNVVLSWNNITDKNGVIAEIQKGIPKDLSEFNNDAGFITTITDDMVSAFTIAGNQIRGNTIASIDGTTTKINLTDGSFTLGGSKGITYDASLKKVKFGSDVEVSWNADDLGISLDGYVKETNFTTLANNWISTAKISANNIYGGTIQSLGTNSTKINLDDGTFSFGNGSLSYDGSTLSVTGKVTAREGEFAGWVITSTGLKRVSDLTANNYNRVNPSSSISILDWLDFSKINSWSSNSFGSSTVQQAANSGDMYFGNSGLAISNNFTVDSTGYMKSQSGKIGGFRIDKEGIYSENTATGDHSFNFALKSNLTVDGSNYAITPYWWDYAYRQTGQSGYKRIAGDLTINNWTEGGRLHTSYEAANKFENGHYSAGYCDVVIVNRNTSTNKSTGYTSEFNADGNIYSKYQEWNGTTYKNVTNSMPSSYTLSRTLTLSGNTGVRLTNNLTNKFIFTLTNAGDINTTGSIKFKDDEGTTDRPVIGSATDTNGKILYINGQTDTKLYIKGHFGSSSTSTLTLGSGTSDIRLKKNIEQSTVEALPLINNIKIRSFDWIESDKHQSIGFVADELEELDDNLAYGGGYDEMGDKIIKSVDTFYLTGYLVKAIQELSAELDELKSQLNNK